MLNLLRKIRRRLVAEKNIRNYLLYAVGEIVLIVVGILLALGISNWQEERRNERKEQYYLDGLRSEFELSRTKLQNLIDVNRLNYEEARQIAAWIKSGQTPSEEALSQKLINAFSYEIDYNPNNALLHELISSGDLQYLQNDDLRRHLTGWDAFIQSVHRQEGSLRQLRQHLIDHFRPNGYSIRTILERTGDLRSADASPATASNLAILQSRAFENDLLLFLVTTENTESTFYQPLLAEIESILALVGESSR